MTEQPEQIQALIKRCLQGDQSGFAALYEACAPLIYRLCYGLLMSREDAEDVMQEAFTYAFRNLRRYDPERASFRTWLYTIALSRCRNMYRRKRLPWLDIAHLLSNDLIAPRSETPEMNLARRDAQAILEQALYSLTPRLREAIVLRYGHGLTYREMSDVMACPQKTAESRVRLAHERLRSLLNPAQQTMLEELLSVEWS